MAPRASITSSYISTPARTAESTRLFETEKRNHSNSRLSLNITALLANASAAMVRGNLVLKTLKLTTTNAHQLADHGMKNL